MDNTEVRKKQRIEYFNNHYSDEFLEKIIDDTLNFIICFLENNLNNLNGYADINLLEDSDFIFLNLIGGWFSDVLYTLGSEDKKMIVSSHLLKKFLGSFRIEQDYIIEALVDEDDDFTIYNEYYYPFIRISGSFGLLKEKYEELKKFKQMELAVVLKRKLDKFSNGCI